MKFAVKMLAGAAMATLLVSAHAQKGETVKIALIDPQTGLMGPLGTNQMRSWQYMAEEFSKNNPAGVKFEIVAFDNKLSPARAPTRSRPPSTRASATWPRATAHRCWPRWWTASPSTTTATRARRSCC